jgi:hypothetical protein
MWHSRQTWQRNTPLRLELSLLKLSLWMKWLTSAIGSWNILFSGVKWYVTGFGLIIGFIGLVTTLYKSLLAFTVLLGNVFQQWTFLGCRAHVLAVWRPSHTSLLLLRLHCLKTVSRLTGFPRWSSRYSPRTDPTENTASSSYSIVASVRLHRERFSQRYFHWRRYVAWHFALLRHCLLCHNLVTAVSVD